MKCKGCNQDKKLIKAHIIPESFFIKMKSSDKQLKIITDISGVYPKKSPIGVYDKNILCRDCEDRFQKIDDYGYNVLIADIDKQIPYPDKGEIIGYKLNGIDNSKLKLFFISILWRASISKEVFYSKVNLGDLEKKAQDLIWQQFSGEPDDFSFVLARFDGGAEASKTMLDPHPEQWFNVNYYRFYFYGYVLYIKSDPSETPLTWKDFIPRDDSLNIVSRGKIEKSKEFPLLIKAIQMQKT
ncbi:hypothetical protein ACU5EH_06265 [Aliivibrio salmonicida]|uniref:hypothetical protein n=1 Tax=Aliivibrio salmonicida TaxID=40269 RepID=UPI00406D2070